MPAGVLLLHSPGAAVGGTVVAGISNGFEALAIGGVVTAAGGGGGSSDPPTGNAAVITSKRRRLVLARRAMP